MAQPAQTNGKKGFNWTRLIVSLLVIGALVVLAWWIFFGFGSSDDTQYVSYSELMDHIKGGSGTETYTVVKLGGDVDNYQIWADLKLNGGTVKHYVAYVNPFTFKDDIVNPTNNLFKWVHENPVKTDVNWDLKITKDSAKQFVSSGPYRPQGRPVWVNIIISLIPTLLLVGLMYFMMRGSGAMGGGDGGILSSKSQAQKIVSNKRFKDVAGQEEAKEEVTEVVDFLKRPGKYRAAGARIPKGIMLGGPPGTGKTLLAKAVAGEAGVPFYFISASNFVEMFAGMGAKRVREMFKEARKNAPAILFIDELDAVGRKRGSSLSGNDEREQTLNQILVELDGMVETSGLLVIAATNRPDVLDPALMRPGRFDRTITVNLPDIKEREMILRLHAKGKRISPDVDFANIAKRTPRYSGAELESVINEATLLSVRGNTEVITLEQVDEAIDRVMAGPAKKHRVITEEENKLVAIHEAGHAVVGLKVKDADIVQKITIIPRGDAGGYTLTTPRKEQYNYRKSQLEAKVMGFLGGRAAEQVYYGDGEVTTGASDDIQKATNIARAMVTQYGMSILGPIAYEKPQGSQYLGSDQMSKEYSDALAERIDEAIRQLVLEAEKKAIAIIKKNTNLVDLIVEELLEKETIVVEEIDYIHKHLKRPPKKIVPKKEEVKKSIDDIISEVKNKSNDSKETKSEEVEAKVESETKPKEKPVVKKETPKEATTTKETTTTEKEPSKTEEEENIK